ncbi:hypothetical protein PUW79_07965 [Microbacterium sp. NE2HP2]|uniref:hypothetical protein n=1 Tax=Microbacterium plantarum TaxID=1816425 RepID=UPI002365E323|nr:hypothetical protein [Microbacterium plantarum]MDD7944563.1 hypothetical protein [Microbacterium plantarum]
MSTTTPERDTELPSDRIYNALQQLAGWGELLRDAASGWSGEPVKHNTGRLLSSLLLAGGEDRQPIALTGELDESGTGRVIVYYPGFFVVSDVTAMRGDEGSFTARLWPASSVTDLEVRSAHSYYQGVQDRARHRGMAFSFSLNDERIDVSVRRSYSTDPDLLTDKARYDAFLSLRDAI